MSSADRHDPARRNSKDQLFFIQFKAVPAADNERLAQYGGAYASAWVDAEILEDAWEKAFLSIEAAGWSPVKLMHWDIVRRDDYSAAIHGEDDLRTIRQSIATAIQHGVGLMLSAWPKRARKRGGRSKKN